MNIDNLAVGAIVIFIIKESWSFIKEHNSNMKKSIDQLTLAIQELKIRLDLLNQAISEIPKIKEDVRKLYNHIKQ